MPETMALPPSSPVAAVHVENKPWWRTTWCLHRAQLLAFVLAYVGLSALFVGMGKLITGPLNGAVQPTDDAVAKWFADGRTSFLNPLSTVGSGLAETFTKIAITAFVALAALALWRRWLEPLLLATSLILEASVFITVTLLVRRHRPDVPQLEHSPVSSSFPSGHVAAAVMYGAAVVIVFWHTRKRWIRALAVLSVAAIVLAVALARMYRGMHFLTDILGGMLLGALSLTISTLILRSTDEADEALAPTEEVMR